VSSEHGRALRLLFLCLVCTGIGQAMLFAILPPAAREIGLSELQVSVIFVSSATIWVFVSPFWGRRSDVVGRRRIILIGLLGYALSMVLLATTIGLALDRWLPAATVWPLMVASRCVFALLGSGTGPASQAYVADRTTAGDRTAGVALVNAAFGLGQTLGPAVGAALAVLGLLAPIYFAAALAVVSAAVIWFYLPEGEPVRRTPESRESRLRFHDKRIFPFLLLATSVQAVQATTAITLAFFLQDTLGLGADETGQYAGLGFMALAGAGLLAQLVLVQRLRWTPSFMIHTGMPLSLAAFVLISFEPPYALDLVGLAVLGVGLGLVRPGNAAGASLSVGAEEQGAVAGLLGAIGVLGNVFGPLLGTSLYSLTPTAPFLLNAVIMAAGLTFSLAHPRLRHVHS
jgi:MFS family permease